MVRIQTTMAAMHIFLFYFLHNKCSINQDKKGFILQDAIYDTLAKLLIYFHNVFVIVIYIY